MGAGMPSCWPMVQPGPARRSVETVMSRDSNYALFVSLSRAVDIALFGLILVGAVLVVAFLLGANPAAADTLPRL